jgi:hypothetical protein
MRRQTEQKERHPQGSGACGGAGVQMTLALVGALTGLAVVFAAALYLRGYFRWSWDDPDSSIIASDQPPAKPTASREKRVKRAETDQLRML